MPYTLCIAKSGDGMDRIRIVGGSKLNGTIPISGAKNAALPLMIAGLLTEETLILDNVPRLADVAQLQRILGNHGVDITSVGKRPGDREYQGQTLHISAADIIDTTAPYELVSRMRASFWVIAPLLSYLNRVAPKYMTTSEQLGRAMIKVARDGYPRPVLESEDINAV